MTKRNKDDDIDEQAKDVLAFANEIEGIESFSTEELSKFRKSQIEKMFDDILTKRLDTSHQSESLRRKILKHLEDHVNTMSFEDAVAVLGVLDKASATDANSLKGYLYPDGRSSTQIGISNVIQGSSGIASTEIVKDKETDPRKVLASNNSILEAITIIKNETDNLVNVKDSDS